MGAFLQRARHREDDADNKKHTLHKGFLLPTYMTDGKRANQLLNTRYFPEYEDSISDHGEEEGDGDADGDADADKTSEHSQTEAEAKEKGAALKYKESAIQFFDHAKKGRAARMTFMLYQQSLRQLNILNEESQTPLHVVAANNHIKATGVILDQQLFPIESVLNVQDKYGWTPCHYATFNGCAMILRRLLAVQANPNIKDKHGCTVMHLLASSPKIYYVGLVPHRERIISRVIRRLGAHNLPEGDKYEVRTQPTADHMIDSRRKGALTPEALTALAAQNSAESVFTSHRMEVVMLELLLKNKQTRVDIHARDNNGQNALHYATRHGHHVIVARLIVAKSRIQEYDKQGRTPLSFAAEGDNLELVYLLLKQRADLETSDALCRTPLHHALASKNEDVAKALLLADANIDHFDCEGRTPWMLALETQQAHVFRVLMTMNPNLDAIDSKGRNLLVAALIAGLLPEVVPLINSIGRDAARDLCRWQDPQGWTAMHHAVLLGDMKSVDILVAVDPMLDSRDSNGNTVLHLAAELGHLEIMRVLKEQAETLDPLNDIGETPLHLACHAGEMASVVSLLSPNENMDVADADVLDNLGRTILMRSCCSGNLVLVNLILQNMKGNNASLGFKPIKVNAIDKAGCHALIHAARHGHWHLIPSLVLAGANIHLPDKDGFTPLHWAAYEDENTTCAALIDMSAEPNQVDRRGWAPLMVAVCEGHLAVCQTLLDRDANPYMETHSCETAVGMARRNGEFEIQEMIVTAMRARESSLGIATKEKSIAAEGHFIITVLHADQLGIEGGKTCMNAYVCLQLQAGANSTVQGGFTSCALGDEHPQWHEHFRFEVEALDKDAYLIATVVHVPGITPEEVEHAGHAISTEVGWVEGRFDRRSARGMEQARARARATLAQDAFTHMLNKKPDAYQQQPMQTVPLNKKEQKDADAKLRRWDCLRVIHQTLRNHGVNVPALPVPSLHIPLGVVLIRFRSLREAVLSAKGPVRVTQPLRGCPGADLRMDIDFRPRMWRVDEVDPQEMVRFNTPRNEKEEQSAIDKVLKNGYRGPEAKKSAGYIG
eukprot:gnl/MRDRNA2_/MRDRNA2_86241_c0_seq2.p1 gnl/MRDRNA2_/MRDRNA2_86241_c0~~gnl/MRDRNA2_/MRDRNA2_86241_c0_seq2.p1  ORF type:complete len:1062 (+),score=182.69 gnl/MRDRNA2_/MRDRNA2_86241_c0_seq2:204-3389(+)